MRACNMRRESRSLSQRHRLRKLARGNFNLVPMRNKSLCQRFEKRDVRRVRKINPQPHQFFVPFCGSPLDLDQAAAIAKRRLGRFDHIDHAQARWSICLRLFVVFDAVDEVQCFRL